MEGHSETERLRHELEQYRLRMEELVDRRTRELSKESRRNRIIVESAMDGFFTADLQGNIRDCNEAYCEMLGYTKDELLAMSIPDIEAEETAEDTARHIDYILAHGTDRFDTRHTRKDGSALAVEVKVSIAMIDDERFFFAFIHDISERACRERALLQAREEAERANAAKSEFLSRMSHELRTPLNAMLGFGQLMQTDVENPLTATQADSLDEIMVAARHLLELINEILDLSRIESGRIELSPQWTPARDVIESCVAQLSPVAQQAQLTVHSELHGPERLFLDPTRLRQVLLNLLSNAIKYNRPGGRVDVIYENGAAGAGVIRVRDTGRGIPADKLEVIFQPFERLESALDGIEGTGVGLPVTKRLVEVMGGSIDLESAVDRGTTITVQFPPTASTSQLPA